jgi:hypothetical protein
MEKNSLFPLKYRLRKTDEPVEIVAWDTTVKGARSETDWVSYIDSHGNEHIMERLTLEWDFVIDSPLEKIISGGFGSSLSASDPWESRRYELVKEFIMMKDDCLADAVLKADATIAALNKSPEAIEEYENIGVGEIVEAIGGPERLKKFVFTDRKDIVGFRGDGGRWNVGDRVKVYIKRLEPQEEERPVP